MKRDFFWSSFERVLEAYSEHSKIQRFTTIVDDVKPLDIFEKCSILEVWQGFF